MPGSVSDSKDCEWGTAANRNDIEESLEGVYSLITDQLGAPKPMFILDLIRTTDTKRRVQLTLTVKQWRIIRFALERAKESL